MEVLYQDIFDRCEEMSSYEGYRAKDAEGKSLYEVVHITIQDLTLLEEFAKEAAGQVRTALRYAIEDVNYTTTGIEFATISDARLAISSSLQEELTATIASYCMWHWLSDKLKDRAEAWMNTHVTMLTSLPRKIRKRRPTFNAEY